MGEIRENRSIYAPTNAGKKLAAVLAMRESALLPVRDVCKIANIAESTYFVLLSDPRYTNWLRSLWQAALAGRITAIVEASVQTALEPGRDGHQDRKLLMEMAGVYIPTSNINAALSGLSDAALAVVAGITPDADDREG